METPNTMLKQRIVQLIVASLPILTVLTAAAPLIRGN